MIKIYKCKNCQWEGNVSQLEYDEVEGCFGNDNVEICPECGGYEVYENTIPPTDNCCLFN